MGKLRFGALYLCVLAVAFGQNASQRYILLGWNDLGMHCMDGDYSIYAILPP